MTEQQDRDERYPYPGYEGSIGPFKGQYGDLHVYARDVHSGAGNCVCGRDPRHSIHPEVAPGFPNLGNQNGGVAAFVTGCQDPEQRAAAYNEGFEDAVTQGLADDPTLAAEWLSARLAQAKADGRVEALREAATWIKGDPGSTSGDGIAEWLNTRANRIESEVGR